ncbi:hypothetical protein SARC_04313 [Sphaeroforma arctica JP610]|uniref:Uncharacterized protein n=1 Tax=Sphaeroforma arctica JP610 TaxID=667725 RepID=A0A0L0G3H7_9EUKA|nr:hypothetical protein SARC_04313 [Sphaeroforma arctica JP610]KNC83424.1 hypothetical protein SARC_04313 [Sphaeroforma arctica JP610]|eukprot:XP_014157326.1 hypothetical protein SARC_04313 [Sphaeroforma arctica JP610]
MTQSSYRVREPGDAGDKLTTVRKTVCEVQTPGTALVDVDTEKALEALAASQIKPTPYWQVPVDEGARPIMIGDQYMTHFTLSSKRQPRLTFLDWYIDLRRMLMIGKEAKESDWAALANEEFQHGVYTCQVGPLCL